MVLASDCPSRSFLSPPQKFGALTIPMGALRRIFSGLTTFWQPVRRCNRLKSDLVREDFRWTAALARHQPKPAGLAPLGPPRVAVVTLMDRASDCWIQIESYLLPPQYLGGPVGAVPRLPVRPGGLQEGAVRLRLGSPACTKLCSVPLQRASLLRGSLRLQSLPGFRRQRRAPPAVRPHGGQLGANQGAGDSPAAPKDGLCGCMTDGQAYL